MSKILISVIFLALNYPAESQDLKHNQDLIAKDATVTKVGGGYAFTEGPSVAPDGRVFFTDQPNDKIDVWSEKGNTITTFMQPCERSNGTFFNKLLFPR